MKSTCATLLVAAAMLSQATAQVHSQDRYLWTASDASSGHKDEWGRGANNGNAKRSLRASQRDLHILLETMSMSMPLDQLGLDLSMSMPELEELGLDLSMSMQ